MTNLKIKLLRFAPTMLRSRFTALRSGHITRVIHNIPSLRSGILLRENINGIKFTPLTTQTSLLSFHSGCLTQIIHNLIQNRCLQRRIYFIKESNSSEFLSGTANFVSFLRSKFYEGFNAKLSTLKNLEVYNTNYTQYPFTSLRHTSAGKY